MGGRKLVWVACAESTGSTESSPSRMRMVVLAGRAKGRQHEVWALVEFEMFSFRRIRLRAARTDGIPPSLREILENADAESGKAR